MNLSQHDLFEVGPPVVSFVTHDKFVIQRTVHRDILSDIQRTVHRDILSDIQRTVHRDIFSDIQRTVHRYIV